MYWILFIGIALASWLVQANLKNKFEKYSKIPIDGGLTGRDIAVKMLHDNGIYDVEVASTSGFVVAERIEKLHRLRIHDRVEPPGFPFRVDLVQRQGVAAVEQQIERPRRRLSLRRNRKRQPCRLLRINRVKLEFRIQFGKLFRFRIE